MTDWTAIESQFKELAQALQFERLDFQGGDAGEYWRLAGGADRIAIARFEALAQIAGAALPERITAPFPRVLNERDPTIRWYLALKEMTNLYRGGHYAQMMNDSGVAGHIWTGSIERVADASALLCLQVRSALHRELPDQTNVQIEARTSEEILELKPGAWGIRVNLKALWRWLVRSASGTKIETK